VYAIAIRGIDDLIESALVHFKSMNIRKLSWLAQEGVLSAEMNNALLVNGLMFRKSFATEMAVDLASLPEAQPTHSEMRVVPVVDGCALRQWIHIACIGFRISEKFERVCEQSTVPGQRLCLDRHRALPDQPTTTCLIACPIRGKTRGIRALCRGAGSYRTGHTFCDGSPATLALKASLVPDKTGTRRRKWLTFLIICLDWSVDKIYQEYRRRFGIECSYRMVRRVRATTTSRNPALRFFLLGIGLLLLNVWVFLRWEFARLMARGPYRVAEPLFRFHRFTRWLIRTIDTIYGTICVIPTHKLRNL